MIKHYVLSLNILLLLSPLSDTLATSWSDCAYGAVNQWRYTPGKKYIHWVQ